MKVYIQVYSEYSLNVEMDVTHLPLNKIVPLMFANRFEYTRVTTLINDDGEVIFKYNSRLNRSTTIQELVDAYNR